jgi:hypothetical protein
MHVEVKYMNGVLMVNPEGELVFWGDTIRVIGE